MIKYIGSKRLLLPYIETIVDRLSGGGPVLDLFSGTSRVSRRLKQRGYRVHANDHNRYAHTLAMAYVQADARKLRGRAETVIQELQRVRRRAGYFTKTFCEESRFFQPKNGAKIDAIRERIAKMSLEPELEAIALVSLMEAADRVDSTTGLQMAYLKDWAPRSHNALELRLPNIVDGRGKASCMDAEAVIRRRKFDIAYLDPPYNQHSYLSNYHIWETLVRWDKPEIYGTACKRIDCRTRKSGFNSKQSMPDLFRRLVEKIHANHLVVSFNDEGFLSKTDLERMLAVRGEVRCYPVPNRRYIGARIGIYNPDGKRVGRVSHVQNKEFLFVAGPDAAVLGELDRTIAEFKFHGKAQACLKAS